MDTLTPQRTVCTVASIAAFASDSISTVPHFVTGDVYFDIKSIGDRYGRFVPVVETHTEPGLCFTPLQSFS